MFTEAQALSTLLIIEGFLLASISLSINLDAPNSPRAMSFRLLKPNQLAKIAAFILAFVAVGAFVAWLSIFTGGEFEGISRSVIAAALLVALMAQPALALFLAFGAKRQ